LINYVSSISKENRNKVCILLNNLVFFLVKSKFSEKNFCFANSKDGNQNFIYRNRPWQKYRFTNFWVYQEFKAEKTLLGLQFPYP
jgi:hypothetical protein